MLSDIWKEIYFWNQYGEARENISGRWLSEAGVVMESDARKFVVDELAKVNRVMIEAGSDLSEEDWMDVAKRAKELFGQETVLDIVIRKKLIGGARVVVGGNVVDNTVVTRYRKWRRYE